MAEPISIQQLKDASLDAKSLSEFVNEGANTLVQRRLANPIETLQYWRDYMAGLAKGKDGKDTTNMENSENSGIVAGGSYSGSVISSFLASTAASGKQAYFPKGIYNITSSITIDFGDVSIVGDGSGDGGTQFVSTFNNSPLIKFTHIYPIKNINIADVKLVQGDFGTPQKTSRSVILDDTGEDITNFRMRRVVIISEVQPLVFFGDSLVGTVFNLDIEDCYFEAKGVYTYGFALRKTCDGFRFVNNTVILSSAQSYNNLGIYADSQNFLVSGNLFKGGGHSPIACSPAKYGVIRDNIIENDYFSQTTFEGAIEIEWKEGHLGVGTSHDILVSGNIIRGSYRNGIIVARRDDLAPSPYNITITDNTINNVLQWGISIASLSAALMESHNIIVSNNRITESVNYGICISGANYNTKVINNHITLSGDSGIAIISKKLSPENEKAKSIQVQGNTIVSPTRQGVEVTECLGDIQVNNNTILGAVISGIRAENVVMGLQINGNMINGAGYRGIHITGDGSFVQVNNNCISGTNLDPVSNSTSYAIITGNITDKAIVDTGANGSVTNNLVKPAT